MLTFAIQRKDQRRLDEPLPIQKVDVKGWGKRGPVIPGPGYLFTCFGDLGIIDGHRDYVIRAIAATMLRERRGEQLLGRPRTTRKELVVRTPILIKAVKGTQHP